MRQKNLHRASLVYKPRMNLAANMCFQVWGKACQTQLPHDIAHVRNTVHLRPNLLLSQWVILVPLAK